MEKTYVLKVGKLYLGDFDVSTYSVDSDFVSSINLTSDEGYMQTFRTEESARKLINLFDRVGINFDLCEIESEEAGGRDND